MNQTCNVQVRNGKQEDLVVYSVTGTDMSSRIMLDDLEFARFRFRVASRKVSTARQEISRVFAFEAFCQVG